jgi:hypothetical protein
VQCTLTAKRFSPYLKQYYERLKHGGGSGKAIIATARKFLGIIYRTLKYKWVFRISLFCVSRTIENHLELIFVIEVNMTTDQHDASLADGVCDVDLVTEGSNVH